MNAGRRRLGIGAAALLVCVLAVTVGAARAQTTAYYQATPEVGGIADMWNLSMNPNGWTIGAGYVPEVSPCSPSQECSTEATGVNLSGQVSGFVAYGPPGRH
jgi:hypothetical protein